VLIGLAACGGRLERLGLLLEELMIAEWS